MKLNAKDIAAGVFLILFAIAALWLNQEHAIGSPRRMGPGYMPMLVFLIVLGLGVLVLGFALANGPDPLEKWTGLESLSFAAAIAAGLVAWLVAPSLGSFFGQTYNALGFGTMVGFFVLCWAAGWRMIGFILAAMCAFGLVLETGGLMLAIIVTVAIGALADPDHRARPLGVLGATVFLLGLCWWVFIRQLDIRVPVWPWSY